jgi:hypothetical protein
MHYSLLHRTLQRVGLPVIGKSAYWLLDRSVNQGRLLTASLNRPTSFDYLLDKEDGGVGARSCRDSAEIITADGQTVTGNRE